MASEAQDWAEYLAWTRGAAPDQYELTEALAWRRLQAAHLPILAPSVLASIFVPEEGLDITFEPDTDLL